MKDDSFEALMDAVNMVARQHRHDPTVIGIGVPSSHVEAVAHTWAAQSRSPLRFRSGEWRIDPAPDVEAIRGQLVPVERWGSEGVAPLATPSAFVAVKHRHGFSSIQPCPYGFDEQGPSCISSSGGSLCCGYGGMSIIDGDMLTRCIEPLHVEQQRGREHTMREPLVKFFKDRSEGGNGAFATTTTATEPDDFLRACAEELPTLLSALKGDEEFTLDAVLPEICSIWAKLRGYKADDVFEERKLTAGTPQPEAHMDYLNAPEVVRSEP